MILAWGAIAALLWMGLAYFAFRWFSSVTQSEQGERISFALQSAPWVDQHVESLLARYPRDPTLLWQYVLNAAERKDPQEALRRAELFVSRAPRSPLAWIARADTLRNLGRPEESQAALRQGVRKLPHEPEMLAAWAYEAVARKDWAEAARRFEALRRAAPQRVDGYGGAATALIEDGRPDEAEALIAEGLRVTPAAPLMWHAPPARVAVRLDRLDEAIRLYEAMRSEFPGEPIGWTHGAEALVQAGRDEAAAALIRQARDFFPGNKEIAAAAATLVSAAALPSDGCQ